MGPMLLATPDVEFQAASGKKTPQISILAYSGGVMDVPGWGPVVIELKGLQLADQIALLADHDNSIRGIVGQGTAAVRGNRLYVDGPLSQSTEAGKILLGLHRDGFRFQASVGVEPKTSEFVRAGETITVNGQTIKAGPLGLRYVKEGLLREVTICALGCDAQTSVSIAAQRRGISLETKTADTPGTRTEQDIIHAERTRVQTIEAACVGEWGEFAGEVSQLRAKALSAEITFVDLQSGLLNIVRRDRSISDIRAQAPKGPQIRSPGATGDRKVLEAAFLLRVGRDELAEKAYGEHTCEAARSLRANSFMDLCAAACHLENRDTGGMSRPEMIRAGFSTLSLPEALSNVTGRALWEAYQEAPSAWRSFAKVLPAADFKPQQGIRPSFVGSMEKVAPDGEVKHGTLAESTYPWSIATFGKTLKVTRHDVINDDLGFIDQTAPLMGRMAARGVNDLVWETILANAGSFFHANNANYLSSGSSALDATSLALAITKMRQKRDAENNDLDIRPIVLVVPPELEVAGKQLLESEYIQRLATDKGPTGNPLMKSLTLQVESRISNTAKFANASATAWYLFAGPADAPVIVGYLDGKQTPTVEFFGLDADPNTLGVQWRVYHDYGCALGDHRAAVKSAGA